MTDFTAPQNPTAAGTAAPTAGPAPGAPTDTSFDGGPRPRPTGPPTRWGRPDVTEWLVARANAGATPPSSPPSWSPGMGRRRSRDADDPCAAATTGCCTERCAGRSDSAPSAWPPDCTSSWPTPRPRVGRAAFTLAVVPLPLAGWCPWSAQQVEASSAHAVWSPTRRMWFATPACTAIIGLIRLITYVYLVIAAMTGARHAVDPDDQFQVLISLAIVVLLFVWSFHEWAPIRRRAVGPEGAGPLEGGR